MYFGLGLLVWWDRRHLCDAHHILGNTLATTQKYYNQARILIVRSNRSHIARRVGPDHWVENSAVAALANALAESPRTILQTLADEVLEILQAHSGGLSLLTKDEKRFYWAAIAGAWRPHIGDGTPRDHAVMYWTIISGRRIAPLLVILSVVIS